MQLGSTFLPRGRRHGPPLSKVIDLESPTVMTGADIARWAQIGKNAVPGFVSAFGIRETTGHMQFRKYLVTDVLMRVLQVHPSTEAERLLLFVPLLTVAQVAALSGMSESAISARARAGDTNFPAPVQISTTADAAPRGRRWVHAQVHAHLAGDPDPLVAMRKAAKKFQTPDASNVFAQLVPRNARGSPQGPR